MANFETKTIKQIYDAMLAKYATLRSSYGDTTPLLEKAAIKSIFFAVAGVAGSIWQLATWVYQQCFPQTANLTFLKLWGTLIGVKYKTGVAANAVLHLTDVSAANLAAGTVYKDLASGLIFKTISNAVQSGGEITTTAVCSTSGTAGNLAVGTILNIANPLSGIPDTAEITSISTEGTEDEETEAYRQRVLFGFRNKSECGSAIDYWKWATEVSGIVDALVYCLANNVVKIYLVAQGTGNGRTPTGTVSPNPYPSWVNDNFTPLTGSGQFLAVANSIEGSSAGVHDRRPLTAYVELSAPVYEGYSVEITGLTDTSYNDAIKDAIIEVLDEKRPNIVVLGYDVANAKINKNQLSSAVTAVIESATFSTFILKDDNDQSINEQVLGVGGLPYLKKLTINGTVIVGT